MKKKLTDKQWLRIEKRKWKKVIGKRIRLEKNRRYKEWINTIKIKNNFTCLICNKYLKDGNVHNIQCHHVLAKSSYPEMMYDENNGVLLCYYDHKNSPCSPHLNSFVFVEILRIKRPNQYNYLMNYIKSNHLGLTERQPGVTELKNDDKP